MYVSAWGTSSSSSGRFTLEAWVKSNPDAPVVEVKEEAKPEEAPQQPMFVKSEAFKPTDSGGNPYSYVPETADGITETVGEDSAFLHRKIAQVLNHMMVLGS